MGISITVLVENSARKRDLLAEHGLSFWLDTGARRILFDSGQGQALAHNARVLGIDPGTVDAMVISHGHYDHTGGISSMIRTTADRLPVYVHPAAFRPRYACSPAGVSRDIGVAAADREWLDTHARLIPTPGHTPIPGTGIQLTGPIPRLTPFEDTGGDFFLDPECTKTDLITDDQAAFIDTSEGLLVILGCAHAGVINTLHHIRGLTQKRPIHTVIGGMHLVNASEARLQATVAALKQLQVKRLLPCHCTGFAAMARLWHEFPGACIPCPVGTTLTWQT